MNAAPSIELKAVSKWYGEVMGLNEVTTEFEPGVSGLLGPNGAGKSTMLKVICGMLKPDLGTVRVHGRRVFNRTGVMRIIGLCPEQDAVYPRASALRVTTYLTKLQGFGAKEARERAQRGLERAGLSDAMHRSAAGFSKGMRQRFKLAQALAHDPSVVIMDEPLNGLDPPGRRQFSDVIAELGDEGKCVLVSSHILHEVESLARRILVVYSGRVLAEGTARELREEMSDFPLTVEVRTDTAHAVATALIAVDGVRRIQHTLEGLEIRTEAPRHFFDALGELASDPNIDVQAVVPTDEDLESVFHYLTQ